MFISKNGKRLMAYIMSMAILLSGLIYAPKTADAAGGEPTVTVLGATLRLSGTDDNKNGYQSMRIGIKVANAENAKSCSIKLALGNKSYIVSTKEVGETVAGGEVKTQMTNLCEKGSDYVTYAVVIKKIPKDSFYEQVHITGYADAIESESEVSSTPEARNVMGVVNALQEKYPELGIHINDEGTLCKTGDVILAAEDLDGYSDKPAGDEIENVDLSNFKHADDNNNCTVKYNDNDLIFPSDNLGWINIPLSKSVATGKSIIIKIEGNVGEQSNGFRCWPSQGADGNVVDNPNLFTHEAKGDFSREETFMITHDSANSICIKGKDYLNPDVKDITIKSITITYLGIDKAPVEPGLVDLSTFDANNNASASYDSATGYVNIENDNVNQYSFKLPITATTGDKVNVTVTGSYEGTKALRCWIAKSGNVWTNVTDGTPELPNTSGNFESKLTLTLTDEGGFICLKAYNGNALDGKLVIKKIKVEKATN